MHARYVTKPVKEHQTRFASIQRSDRWIVEVPALAALLITGGFGAQSHLVSGSPARDTYYDIVAI